MADGKFLSVEDVAERMQASTATVRRWLREGRLQGIRPGGRKLGWRISEADLQRFIDESREATVAAGGAG